MVKNYLNNSQNHFWSVNWMSVILHSQILQKHSAGQKLPKLFSGLRVKDCNLLPDWLLKSYKSPVGYFGSVDCIKAWFPVHSIVPGVQDRKEREERERERERKKKNKNNKKIEREREREREAPPLPTRAPRGPAAPCMQQGLQLWPGKERGKHQPFERTMSSWWLTRYTVRAEIITELILEKAVQWL